MLVLAVGLALLSPIGWAEAGHNDTVKSRCTYETPEEPQLLALDFAKEDPIGVTEDGAINNGGCLWTMPDSDPGEDTGDCPTCGLEHHAIDGARELQGEYSIAQASIVDDVYGSGVIAGAIAGDFDHDHVVGEEGEPLFNFCGTSPVVESTQDADGDGHDDFGWGLFVAYHGPINQALQCDATQAPTSTTGGVLDPAGGIYLTVGG